MRNKLIYHMEYKNKYLEIPLRILEPFVFILTGVIDIFLLPTPYTCNLHTTLLHALVRKQMKIRIKRLENEQK